MMKQLYLKIYNAIFARSLYVIADATDTSITLSRRLCSHMRLFKQDEARVFVFALPHNGAYGFTLNPKFEQDTCLCDIQYNTKHHCIGFETLCPTVARIFYAYGINMRRVRLSVKICRTKDGTIYYEILRPHD